MQIETKYNIGDKVWIIEDNKIYCREIQGVATYRCELKQYNEEWYDFVRNGTKYHKSDLYPTKQDLLNSL